MQVCDTRLYQWVKKVHFVPHAVFNTLIDNDEYFYGRLFPFTRLGFLANSPAKTLKVKNIARPGETISSSRYESRVGGKGTNQAIAITRAGGIADFYGTIGQDGLWIKEKVTKFGLDDSGIIVSNVRSPPISTDDGL